MQTVTEPAQAPVPSRQDFVELTKARLSTLVVVTTAAGFVAGWPAGTPFDGWKLLHTVAGTLLAAFGAAVFNQLLEIEVDRRMKRTAERPLPAGRLHPVGAFVIGWVLASFGMVHLAAKVNGHAALLAGLTIAIYIFVYTPLKRFSSWNTVVGAVAGAIPPVIGWVGAGGGYDAGALWLFALLFLWQMPHFFAINWIYREEYSRAGFVMLANEDNDGRRTAWWSLVFAIGLILLGPLAPLAGIAAWWFAVPGALAGAWVTWLAVRFQKERTPALAKKLFFGTLLYLPVVLIALLLA